MKTRFALIVDDATPAAQDKVTEFLKGKFGYWHYFSDLWLLTTSSESWDVGTIRDEIEALLGDPAVLVLKVDTPAGGSWSGRGQADMFAWLKRNWREEPAVPKQSE